MNKSATLCAITLLSLAGCTPQPIVKSPTNAEMLYGSALDAGSKIVKKNANILEKKTIALHNLDRASTAQSPVGNIVRDALTESVYPTGRGLMERDSSAFAAAVKENGKRDTRLEGEYVNGETYNTFIDTVSVTGKGDVTTADMILAYRITDAGIIYEQDRKQLSVLNRQAKTDLFYELISAESGQVVSTGRVSGRTADAIPASERGNLERPARQAPSYPFESKP